MFMYTYFFIVLLTQSLMNIFISVLLRYYLHVALLV